MLGNPWRWGTIPFSAIDRLGSLQGLQAPTTCWNRARWKFGGGGKEKNIMLIYEI
jgi:hypothetical protein